VGLIAWTFATALSTVKREQTLAMLFGPQPAPHGFLSRVADY
jgi:hypothetical protein